jgi:hypothetical protein
MLSGEKDRSALCVRAPSYEAARLETTGAEMMELREMTEKYRKKGEYVSRVIVGETIVVPVRGQVGDLDAIYNFNDVASAIWNAIDGQTSLGGIADALCAEFEVAPDKAAADTLAFVGRLEQAGLVERAEAL